MSPFLRGPRWILSHLFVLALVVAMVNLGLWQLRRLEERRDENQLIENRMAAAPVTIDELLASGEAAEFRRVSVTGTFAAAGEAYVANRNLDGVPGSWLLTPLVRDGAVAVVVNRGFVPRAVVAAPALAALTPPAGEVTVEGLALDSAEGASLGRTGDDEIPELSVADVSMVAEIAGFAVAPVYVQALAYSPSSSTDLPTVLPEPVLDEGPHLGYAAQWFIFSTIGVVGYALVLRRIARGDQSRGDVAPDWDL